MQLVCRALLIAFALVLLPACGSDDPAGPGGDDPTLDTTPPATVSDLQVLTYDASTATIIWTAPGDDGSDGTATGYQIAYSTSAITPASWTTCTMLSACPDPTPAGSQQDAQIDTPPTPDIYVALRAVDEAGNWSQISNVAHGYLAGTFDAVQLTFEGNNRYPSLDGGYVTWVGWRSIEGEEIWIAGLGGAVAAPHALTDNGGEKMFPSSHGREKIAWMGRSGPGEDWEIWTYSMSSVPRFSAFTDNVIPDLYPSMAGGGDFTWLQGPTVHEAVRYWDEITHSQFSISDACCPTTEYGSERPAADRQGRVIWRTWHREGTGEHRVYLWNGALDDVTETIGQGVNYSMDEGLVAYDSGGHQPHVWFWNGTARTDIGAGRNPSLNGGWIAYEGWDGDWEIFLWDGVNTIQVTDNDYEDYDPSLDGSLLAWNGRPTGQGGLYQIFYTRLPDR